MQNQMLVTRSPLALSFVGGGTDIPSYYEKYGGMAITATIDRYSYVILNNRGDGELQLEADSEYQMGGRSDPATEGIRARVHQAVVDRFRPGCGLSIFITSQIPDPAGFGSVTSEALALAKALAEFTTGPIDARALAELATELELEVLGLPIGRQNHYACAFGGLNCLTFDPGGVDVMPIALDTGTMAEFERRLMLFYTGRPSNWYPILESRRRGSERNRAGVVQALHGSKRTAVGLLNDLCRGEIDTVGEWLNEQWTAKKMVAEGVSDVWIDQWYDAARQAGATGGKIVGAGGGGFLLLYCLPVRQPAVTTTLESLGLRRVAFSLDPDGTTTSAMQSPQPVMTHA